MTTYNTQNPLGSSDPRDLYDNAENLDNLVNGAQPAYDDRLGQARKSWAGMEQDFADFLASSGYQFLGDYAAGIEVTSYNQVIRDGGEFWRAAADTELPYTTTGAGLPEGGAFVAVGDAVLRQELGDPAQGGELVRVATSTGEQSLPEALNSRAVSANLESQVAGSEGSRLIGYMNRSQFSRNRDQIHIFDYTPEAEHFPILTRTSTADHTAYLQAAIDALPEAGGLINLPDQGLLNITSVNIDKIRVTIRGGGAYSTQVNGTLGTAVIFNVTKPQFRMQGFSVYGTSDTVEKGTNNTQIALRLSDVGNNLDARVEDCSFAYLRTCVDMQGRNLRIDRTLFSNSNVGILIENNSLIDVRGLEVYGCRFHSMGKVGNPNEACISIDPAANFFETLIKDCYSDDDNTFFRGFSGSISITGTSHTRAKGPIFTVDSSTSGMAMDRRSFSVDGLLFTGNTTTDIRPACSFNGPMHLKLNDVFINKWGGSGFIIQTDYPKITNCVALNIGQESLAAEYYGFYVSGLRAFLDGNYVRVDSGDNIRSAFRLDAGSGFSVLGTNYTPNLPESKAYEISSTITVYGEVPSALPRREQAGAAAPVSGTWARGDILWNAAPVATGNVGWVCVAAGSPGTWKSFGTIAA